jgi:hypothetical protein
MLISPFVYLIGTTFFRQQKSRIGRQKLKIFCNWAPKMKFSAYDIGGA